MVWLYRSPIAHLPAYAAATIHIGLGRGKYNTVLEAEVPVFLFREGFVFGLVLNLGKFSVLSCFFKTPYSKYRIPSLLIPGRFHGSGKIVLVF